MPGKRGTLIERFWRHVDIDNDDNCWNWNGWKDHRGYGAISNHPIQKQVKVHRLSYEIAFGEIPENLLVCHKCNNKLCVNPHHLYAGTHKDNSRDAVEAGVFSKRKGEQNARAKLSEKEVIEIRNLYSCSDVGRADLARKYGVSYQQINKIVLREEWTHI